MTTPCWLAVSGGATVCDTGYGPTWCWVDVITTGVAMTAPASRRLLQHMPHNVKNTNSMKQITIGMKMSIVKRGVTVADQTRPLVQWTTLKHFKWWSCYAPATSNLS
uniref:(northern house mosquito) hypothetical protein n=1 Tax=Culex pipiens TaxID=7175 RepID=A0A8D8MIU4_CULPI